VVVASVPVQPWKVALQSPTLLAENAHGKKAPGDPVDIAELHLGRGTGHWANGEFATKVVGEVLFLVQVEFAGGVRSGFAAIQFEDGCAASAGTLFMFSFWPTAMRYPPRDKTKAFGLSDLSFSFRAGCLIIFKRGSTCRRWVADAVPSC
jgi:hypothetical protein